MNGDKRVRAVFEREQPSTYTLRLEATPNDGTGGYVHAYNGTGSRAGQRVFDAGATARLEARPNSGWRFARWEVDASGSGASLNLTMNGDKRVRAVFEREPAQAKTVTLYLRADPGDGTGGYVHLSNGSGSTPGQRDFAVGDKPKLEARPAQGWCFHSWSGVTLATVWDYFNSKATFVIEGDLTVTAKFTTSCD